MSNKYICKDCGKEFCTCASDRIQKGCPECGATWPHTKQASTLTEEERLEIEVRKVKGEKTNS